MLEFLGGRSKDYEQEQRHNRQPVARMDSSRERGKYHFAKYNGCVKPTFRKAKVRRTCELSGHKADSARADWTVSRTGRTRRSAAGGTAFGCRDDGIRGQPGPGMPDFEPE